MAELLVLNHEAPNTLRQYSSTETSWVSLRLAADLNRLYQPGRFQRADQLLFKVGILSSLYPSQDRVPAVLHGSCLCSIQSTLVLPETKPAPGLCS